MLAVLNRLGFPYNKMKAIKRLLVYHNVDSSCFCLSSGFVKEVNSHSQLVLYYIILYKWPEFYYDLVYKFKTIVHRADFSDQFRKIIVRYKRIGYNINIMRQSACLVCLT